MFIGAKVRHKSEKFGTGIIKDLEINSENQLSSKVLVEFDNGITTKFSIKSFEENGMFTTNDKEIIPFVETIKSEAEAKRLAKLKAIAESIVYIPSYNKDEYNKQVTKADWEKAMKVANDYRFPHESRAVIMDSDLIFINASAAMRYMESRIKDCDKIYKACESGKKFLGCAWKYANKEDIEHIINTFEDSNAD